MAMSASAADVRSILSIPGPSSTPGPSQPRPKPVAASTKKPDNISRELYSLIGPSAPALAAQLAKPRLKQKPNLGSGGKVKWEQRAFLNGGRTDKLVLKHWVKASTAPDAEYPFAQYNVSSGAYSYTDEEYARLLDDKDWSKEETDYLFNIVGEFDVRWHVIYDRYGYIGTVPRSMEDIKDRYYSICRKLVRDRPWAGDETSKQNTLAALTFDKDREMTRKRHIMSLDHRTAEQIAEEEALFIEIKRIEQNERRFRRERDDLLRTLAGIDSGLPDVVEDDNSIIINTGETRKRKKGGYDLDSPISTPIVPQPPTPVKRLQSAKDAAQDARNMITRNELPPNTAATKAAHQPVYLRSHKIAYPKPQIQPHVTEIMTEVGVNINRLVMPTADNVAKMDALILAATNLYDLKRANDKLDQDLRVAKERLGLRNSGDAMDVDDHVDGRAQSVISTKSGRARNRLQRSVSVSSVDTTATASARPPRRKR